MLRLSLARTSTALVALTALALTACEEKPTAQPDTTANAEAAPDKTAEPEAEKPTDEGTEEAAADKPEQPEEADDKADAPPDTEAAAPTAAGTAAAGTTVAAAPTEKDITAKSSIKKPPAEDAKKPTGPVAGKQSTVTASATAEEGYKCNDSYPHKFTAKGGSNVDYPSDKVKGACAGTKGVAVTVPYIPKAEGPGTVAGTLKYGICDEAKTNCRMMTKQVTLSFTASAAN